MTDATERLCPSCGHANPVDAQFCRECGAILVQARDAPRRAAEAPSPEPGESPRAIEPVRFEPERFSPRFTLLAVGGALSILVVALVAYQRFHTNELIPVPGDSVPTAIPPREAPSEQAAMQPTASAEVQQRRGVPPAPEAPHRREAARVGEAPDARDTERATEAPPVREQARARAVATQEPPAAEPTLAPRAAARAVAPRNDEHVEDARARRQPGWYRVRYRSPLFQAPSETAPIVTQIPAGTRIHVTRVLPGFLAVESTTGKPPGYLSSDDALPDSVAGPVR